MNAEPLHFSYEGKNRLAMEEEQLLKESRIGR
jgi:hypothetical protein